MCLIEIRVISHCGDPESEPGQEDLQEMDSGPPWFAEAVLINSAQDSPHPLSKTLHRNNVVLDLIHHAHIVASGTQGLQLPANDGVLRMILVGQHADTCRECAAR